MSDKPTKAAGAPARKLRVLIAGEFNTGKTRLVNGLLGARVLPSDVVATALPPVWLVRGTDPACLAVTHEGATHPLGAVTEADLTTDAYCVLSHDAAVLGRLDLIDTPGRSNPNLPAESRQHMLGYADRLIWCTNATQAWRQSEKAAWEEMPAPLTAHATLLVTHADHLPEAASRERLMRRITREAGGLFETILLVSLLDAGDLARIAAHLGTLTDDPALPRPGAPAPPVAEFARRHERVVELGAHMPRVKPRRVAAPAAAAAMPAAPPGPARARWDVIAQDLDTEDAAALRDAIDQLIAALDAETPAATAIPAATPPGGHDIAPAHPAPPLRPREEIPQQRHEALGVEGTIALIRSELNRSQP